MDGSEDKGKGFNVKKVNKTKVKDGRYVFCRNRVAAFTVLAIMFPLFGFGFISLPYIREIEMYTRSAAIPVLLIVNFASIVIFMCFWLIVIGILLMVLAF